MSWLKAHPLVTKQGLLLFTDLVCTTRYGLHGFSVSSAMLLPNPPLLNLWLLLEAFQCSF